MDNFKNKTLPTKSQERNRKICDGSRWILTIPVVVEPVVVPIGLAIVPVEIVDIQVTVRRIPKSV
jgi:hypothetical protein